MYQEEFIIFRELLSFYLMLTMSVSVAGRVG